MVEKTVVKKLYWLVNNTGVTEFLFAAIEANVIFKKLLYF